MAVNFGYETSGTPGCNGWALWTAETWPQDEAMYILLRHIDGRFQEAMLLSFGSSSMRVSIPGEDDAVELTLRDGQWISENNDVMEIEFIAATAEGGWNRVFDQRLAPESGDSMERTASGKVPAVRRPTVLVVEDDCGVREYVANALAISGFGVVGASDASQALESIMQPVDVVLTDVVMPGMDGVALAAEIERVIPETPVVLMSASGSLGFSDARWPCISKPFKLETLIETLNSALSQPFGTIDEIR